jgi:diadenosine tetraphosphate (Ap4A) HIT family hydrolase
MDYRDTINYYNNNNSLQIIFHFHKHIYYYL